MPKNHVGPAASVARVRPKKAKVWYIFGKMGARFLLLVALAARADAFGKPGASGGGLLWPFLT